MDISYLQSKPIFDFTDLELKAIGFEISEVINTHERNLVMVRNELTRRSMSNVVATMSPEQFNKSMSPQIKNKITE
jgi:hypothetical protein